MGMGKDITKHLSPGPVGTGKVINWWHWQHFGFLETVLGKEGYYKLACTLETLSPDGYTKS